MPRPLRIGHEQVSCPVGSGFENLQQAGRPSVEKDCFEDASRERVFAG